MKFAIFRGQFQFLNLFKGKKLKLRSDLEPAFKYFGEKKYHSIESLYLQNCFDMSKNSGNSSKKYIYD